MGKSELKKNSAEGLGFFNVSWLEFVDEDGGAGAVVGRRGFGEVNG